MSSGHKKCFKCGICLPLSEFYIHPKMRDGHLNKCKSCTKADTRSDYRLNIDAHKAYELNRERDPHRKASKLKYMQTHRARYPEKYKARCKVANALRYGRISKGACAICGGKEVQAHHHDYTKPLDVTWLCFKCHRESEHGQSGVVKDS